MTRRLLWMVVCCLPFISGCKQSECAISENAIDDTIYQNLPFDMPKVQQPVFPAYEVNISKFGAKGDGMTLNTKAINDAIKEVNQRGGGKVIIPEGTWLTGPIELLSNVNLYTERNALVLFTGDFEAYPIIPTSFEGLDTRRCQSPISARDAENIAITGYGIFDGNGDCWRPVKKEKLTASQWNKLVKSGVGTKALERVLRKLGQKKVASGKYTMVVDPMNASNLLSPVLSALYGSALQQKNSFLLDKLNVKVGTGLLNLMDEPHLIGASGARYFDSEGVATERRSIFEEGVLKTYFIDTYNSKKMGVEPTVNSPSLLVLKPGNKDLNGLVADVQKGILVTGFNGGNCNSSSGDFSYGIEGFLIENGKLTQPVSEMNVTGNMITLWASLSAVGNDPRMSSSWRIPSLVFEGVDFSGL